MRQLIQTWLTLARERRLLAQLDDRALHDIGLSRADADEESRRPFWDHAAKHRPTTKLIRVIE